MRKWIVTNIISVDGYYEGPERDVMALPFEEAFDDYNAERLRAADTLLLGRTTFEGLQGFWPAIADDSTARPVLREISRLNNAIDKVVISDSLTPRQLTAWRNTRIVKRADADAQIAELKRQPSNDILTFGSRTMWNALLSRGLVDELHLMIGAAFLGGGTPVYGGPPRVPLQLLDSRTLAGSGLILARYGRSQEAST
jgi:dihydrofolate reductase